jgi:iron complex outermembrane receptor protein
MGARLRLLTLALCGTALSPLPALAQAAPAAELEVVIVTAQKREEALVEVPISIASMSAETLEEANIEGLLSLAQTTPGVVVNRFGVATQPTIRGVTSRNGENSVSTYVDGFYRPNFVGLNLDFANIQRVDVLKGPQGTLFGRNSTGGAILITTLDPSQKFTLKASAGVEENGGRQASFYISDGLTDTLAFNFSADIRMNDGIVKEVNTGDDAADVEHQNYRTKLKWTPSDTVSMTLIGEYGVSSDATTVNLAIYEHALLPATRGDNLVSSGLIPKSDANYYGVYLTGSYEMPTTLFTTYTGYRRESDRLFVDLDGSRSTLFFQNFWRTKENTFTHEMNLSSTGERTVDWVTGAFFFVDGVTVDEVPNNFVGFTRTSRTVQDTFAWALFADATWHVTDRLSLILGGRYSWEQKKFNFVATGVAGNPAFVNAGAAQATWSDFTPRVVLRYEVAENTNVYGSWSRGFKSGLFNPAPVASSLGQVRPENINAYEVGFKTAQRGWAFDAAAFHYGWENIHFSRFSIAGVTIQNAAEAEIYGAEAALTISPAAGLNIRTGVAYTHGEYTDFPDASASIAVVPSNPLSPNTVTVAQNWKGNPTIRTPEWTANLGGDYTIPAGSGAVILAGNIYYTSKFFPNTSREDPLTGKPDLSAGPYTLVNLSATWMVNDHLSATVYGRNVLDKKYIIGHDANFFGQWRLFGEPRVLGAKLTYKY